MKKRLLLLSMTALLFVSAKARTVCQYTVCPSGDMTGYVDAIAIQTAVNGGGIVTLKPGAYYVTQTNPASVGLINVITDTVTIDGGEWNHTTLHMVGTETHPAADWYLFFVQYRDGVTIKNLTIDGSMLDTNAEQTHGIVIREVTNFTAENVRGQYIYGDTAKILYTCNNCQFLNTEHLNNGRSGIAMRGAPPNSLPTYGGITIDGLLCIDVSDQCIDMETGITPGDMVLSNGRVYAPASNPMCMAITGELDANGQPGLRVTMDNWQVYCPMHLFNAGQVTISNSLFDATASGGVTLLIQKASHDVIISDSILMGTGTGYGGVIHLTMHNSGRPSHVQLNNLIIKATPPGVNQSVGIDIYDAANVSIDNVDIQTAVKLYAGVRWRNVISGIDRGYFAVDGLRVNNAYLGVYVQDTTQLPVSMFDTVTVQGSHFRNVTYGIVLENPAYHSTPYVRTWDFSGNVFGEGVGTAVIIGSVFEPPEKE